MELPVGYEIKGSKYDDWAITGLPITGHTCDLFPAHSDIADLDVYIKVPQDQGNTDLVEQEQNALGILRADTDTVPGDIPSIDAIERIKFRWFVPNLVDTAYLYDGADIWTANIIERLDGFHTLTDVRSRFPNGVNPKDAAWMWRRLLMAVGFAHRQGLIHGAPLPENILIHPEKHGLCLVDWCYSASLDSPLRALVGDYRDWYPHEVEAKLSAEPCTDIHLATKTMLWLMGDQTPPQLKAFAQACTRHSRAARPHDAWGLRMQFDSLIERLWGPRRFREFNFPVTNA